MKFFKTVGYIFLVLIGFSAIFSITYNWNWIETFHPIISGFLLAFSKYSAKLLSVLILFFIFGIIQKSITEFFLNIIFKRFTDDEDILFSFKKIFGFIWWFIYVITIFIIFIGGISNLITFLGLIGLGFSLAFQKPILNIVGWFSIVSKRIYKEGDRIEVYPLRGEVVRGDVISVGLFYTELVALLGSTQTKDTKKITFPNEFILMSQIKNFSVDSNYIKDEIVIYLSLDSDYETAMVILKKNIEEVMKNNLKRYLRVIKKKILNVEFSIKDIVKTTNKTKDEKTKEDAISQVSELKEKTTELEDEMKRTQEIGEDFKPSVHFSIRGGNLCIVGLYIVPYHYFRTTRTAIFLNFYKEVKKHRKIKMVESNQIFQFRE